MFMLMLLILASEVWLELKSMKKLGRKSEFGIKQEV